MRASDYVCNTCGSVAYYALAVRIDGLSNVAAPAGYLERTRLNSVVFVEQ